MFGNNDYKKIFGNIAPINDMTYAEFVYLSTIKETTKRLIELGYSHAEGVKIVGDEVEFALMGIDPTERDLRFPITTRDQYFTQPKLPAC